MFPFFVENGMKTFCLLLYTTVRDKPWDEPKKIAKLMRQ